MIVCPVCGSPSSLRLSETQRECRDCYWRYDLPKPRKRRARKTIEEPIAVESGEENTEE